MDLKNKLINREVTIGSWITIGNPIVAEIMARSGFDWLTIDMEHSSITLDVAQDLIRVIELCGVPPLVRISNNDQNIIKRVMDAGAHGIIVPMVNSRDDALNAVNALKYPPIGSRGVGLARAQKYGTDFEGYRKWNHEKSILIVQIEHINAVDNLEDILGVEGVDGFIVGPYDLSGSLGLPGQFENPKVSEALSRVEETSQKIAALSGFHVIPPDVSEVKKKISKGYRFIAFSLDILFLGETSRNSALLCKDMMHSLNNKISH
jgi:2-keto-3-deoxy-L-rhamnonate aldolase RhmA